MLKLLRPMKQPLDLPEGTIIEVCRYGVLSIKPPHLEEVRTSVLLGEIFNIVPVETPSDGSDFVGGA